MIATKDQLTRLLGKIDTLSPKDAMALLSSLAKEVNEKAAEDGIFWLRFAQTRDEADPLESIKPFPLYLEYPKALWKVLEEKQKVVIAKSRQMLVSWILACFVVHWARYRPNQAIYWQTKGWEDAVGMVCMPGGGFEGRCQFIENHLPSWMQVDYKPSEGRIQYPNGSIIQALSGGADKIRGKTASIYVSDEFAHQEDQAGVYTAVAPLIQKGAKAIFCSTPNGAMNTYATLFHGRPVGIGE